MSDELKSDVFVLHRGGISQGNAIRIAANNGHIEVVLLLLRKAF